MVPSVGDVRRRSFGTAAHFDPILLQYGGVARRIHYFRRTRYQNPCTGLERALSILGDAHIRASDLLADLLQMQLTAMNSNRVAILEK